MLGAGLQDACYLPAAARLAACLLRLVLATPTLHTSPQALILAENIVRHLATTHSPSPTGTHPGSGAVASAAQQGVRGHMRRSYTGTTPPLSPAGSMATAAAAAVVIPVVPASHAGTTTVTPGGAIAPGAAQQSPGGLGPALLGPGGSVSGAGAPLSLLCQPRCSTLWLLRRACRGMHCWGRWTARRAAGRRCWLRLRVSGCGRR